ncbi:MAG TPA: hypothetical protein ENN88_03770 [Candidatus Coatesbacteria bacterium]|nr:hypothetical protein [Candidatus Coatesbacteria bacterium]
MIRRILLIFLAGASVAADEPGLLADYFPLRAPAAYFLCTYTPQDAEPYSYELNRWHRPPVAAMEGVRWVDTNMAYRVEGDAVQFYDYTDGQLVELPHRLEFPLEPGGTWVYTTQEGRTALAAVDCLDGVTVPYGTHDGCYRVAFIEQGVGEWTLVLAPGHGVVREWGELYGVCSWECKLVRYDEAANPADVGNKNR